MSNRLFEVLESISARLADNLERALYNLDELRKFLVDRFYRALRYLDKIRIAIRDLFRVIFPILLIFILPCLGIFSSLFFFAKSRALGGIILLLMSAVLLLLTLFSFNTKIETSVQDARLQLPPSSGARMFGIVLAAILLLVAWFLDGGFFAGIVLYILEFVLIFYLKGFYFASEDRPR